MSEYYAQITWQRGKQDFLDLGLLKAGFFQPPGPSGLDCAGVLPCPEDATPESGSSTDGRLGRWLSGTR